MNRNFKHQLTKKLSRYRRRLDYFNKRENLHKVRVYEQLYIGMKVRIYWEKYKNDRKYNTKFN